MDRWIADKAPSLYRGGSLGPVSQANRGGLINPILLVLLFLLWSAMQEMIITDSKYECGQGNLIDGQG